MWEEREIWWGINCEDKMEMQNKLDETMHHLD